MYKIIIWLILLIGFTFGQYDPNETYSIFYWEASDGYQFIAGTDSVEHVRDRNGNMTFIHNNLNSKQHKGTGTARGLTFSRTDSTLYYIPSDSTTYRELLCPRTRDFTISLLFKTTESSDEQWLYGTGTKHAGVGMSATIYMSSNVLRGETYDSDGGTAYATNSGALTDNTVYFASYRVKRDGTEYSWLYVNGDTVTDNSKKEVNSVDIYDATESSYLGGYFVETNNNPAGVTLYAIRVDTVALTFSQQATLYTHWLAKYSTNPFSFYVSSTGDNDNTGALSTEPFLNLAGASSTTYSSGDSLLLKRGETFSDSLVIPSNGLVVGTYGSGDRPRIAKFIDPNGKTSLTVSNCIRFSGWTYDYSTCADDSSETILKNRYRAKVRSHR